MSRTIAVGGLASALTILLVSACGRSDAYTTRSVLLLVIDGVVADAVGCYGDPAARTPLLDRLARQGAQFRDAQAPSTSSRASRATILSGTHPFEHGIRGQGVGSFDPPAATLAEAVVVANLRVLAFDPDYEDPVLRGFQASGLNAQESPADQLTEDVPFLLYARTRGTAADRRLCRMLQGLEESDRLKRTLVIAAGCPDEGSLTEADLRIPLLAWGPSPFRGGRVRTGPAGLLDIYRTAMHALRIGPHYKVSGRALQEVLEVHKRHRVEIYAEAPTDSGFARSIRVEDWKYVGDPPRLFDLAADPGERRDVHTERPEVTSRLAARLADLIEADAAQ